MPDREARILGVPMSMLRHVLTSETTWRESLPWSEASLSGHRRITGVSKHPLRLRFYYWYLTDGIDKHSESRRQHLPDAAAVLCLQGKLWHAHKDIHKAVDCYVEALKLNPFLWDAFLGLSETGTSGFAVLPRYFCSIWVVNKYRCKCESAEHLQDDTRDGGDAHSISLGELIL